MASFANLAREQGFRSLWRGNMATVFHRFPYSGINFLVYERAKVTIGKAVRSEDTVAIRFLSGAIGGGIATAACYPLDLMRARLAVQRTCHLGLLAGARSIVRTDGVAGLYRGLNLSLLVAVPNMAISYCAYDTAKSLLLCRRLHGRFMDPHSGKLNTCGSITAGAASGFVAATLTFPLDLLRRRCQVHGLRQGGIWSILHGVVAARGVRGLYSGLACELVKVVPMCAVTFSTYEFGMRLLSPRVSVAEAPAVRRTSSAGSRAAVGPSAVAKHLRVESDADTEFFSCAPAGEAIES